MNPFRRLKYVGVGHAADSLERLGFAIVERNIRIRSCAIDLIAHDDARIVFCEVTTHRRAWSAPNRTRPWPPSPGVHDAATTWLRQTDSQLPADARLRFDSMDITLDLLGRLLRLEHSTVEHPPPIRPRGTDCDQNQRSHRPNEAQRHDAAQR